MGEGVIGLIKTLPAELLVGVALAFAILSIGGMAVGLIEFAFRKGLLSASNARHLSLMTVATTVTGATVLIISLVLLHLINMFSGTTPV